MPFAEDRLGRPIAEQVDPRPAEPDVRVAARAAEEWSVLSLKELRECGLSKDQVTTRVRKGWLHRVYPTVYAVDIPLSPCRVNFWPRSRAWGKEPY
jgi:hypothetical protein